MKRYAADKLEALAAALAEHVGVPPGDAQILARSLVAADAHGTTTHGLSRLAIYLERIERGLIDPRAPLTVDHQSGAVLSVDAGNGLGQVQAVKTLDLLKPLARTHGVASATIRQSQHFGALSYFTELAAKEQMILLAMTSSEPIPLPFRSPWKIAIR